MPVPINDYDNQAINQLPFRERKPKWIVMAKALVSQIKWLYQIFVAFMKGETLSAWNSATSYAAGNKVRYNFGTWESLIDGNINNIPNNSPTAWILRNTSFIGATERVKYNGRYLTLTYALNRYFNTTFRQPPYPAPYDNGLGVGTWSDIYIGNIETVFASFVSYNTETLTSKVYTNSTANNAVFTTEVYAAATSFQFAINIPIAVFNLLGTNDTIREAVVRRIADKYVVSGTNYIIVTY